MTPDAALRRYSSTSSKRSQRLEEVEVDPARGAVPVLQHVQLGGALDAAVGLVHLLAKEREYDVGELHGRAEHAEVAKRGTWIGAAGGGGGERHDHQQRDVELLRESLEHRNRGGQLLVARALAGGQAGQGVHDGQLQVERPPQRVGQRCRVAERNGLQRRGDIAQPEGGGADRGARILAERAAPQLVERDAALDREQALEQACRRHLATGKE